MRKEGIVCALCVMLLLSSLAVAAIPALAAGPALSPTGRTWTLVRDGGGSPRTDGVYDRYTATGPGNWWIYVQNNGLASLTLELSDASGAILSTEKFAFGGNKMGTASSTPVHLSAGQTILISMIGKGKGTATITENFSADVVPVAVFTVTPDPPKATQPATFDGSASFETGGSISAYAWDFGDGSTGTGAVVSHTFAAAAVYTVTLTVTDAAARTGSSGKTLTVTNPSTLETRIYDMFGQPYGSWWALRNAKYGDIVIRNTYPYVDYYPWIERGVAFLYAPYREDVVGTNRPEVTSSTPVYYGEFGDTTIPAGTVKLHWYMQYVDETGRLRLCGEGICVPKGNMDGFILERRGAVTVDRATLSRVYPIPVSEADPVAWFKTNDGNLAPGFSSLDDSLTLWQLQQGITKHDIYNAFEYTYTVWGADVLGNQVTANADGTYTVPFVTVTWGDDVLVARWFYWGTTSYVSAMLDPANNKKQGWAGQELMWAEDETFDATLYPDHMDFHLNAAFEYQLKASARPGPDGVFGTSDDVAAWNWEATYMDYVYPCAAGCGVDPYSELAPYYFDPITTGVGAGKYTYLHLTPGHPLYNKQYKYDYAPVQWNLKPGDRVTFQFPTGPIVYYDPVRSSMVISQTSVTGLVEIQGLAKLDATLPSSLAANYDPATNSLAITGPATTGTDALPLYGTPQMIFVPA